MPTENRSSNTEMVIVPREPTPCMLAASLQADGNLNKWRAMVEAAPAEQHQAEPAAWYDPQHQDFLSAEGRAATLRMGDGDRLARYSVRLFAAPTAAEELDSVRHWRGKHADVIRERDGLRAQLAERDALLRDFLEVATGGFSDSDHVLRVRRHLETFLSASADPEAKL